MTDGYSRLIAVTDRKYFFDREDPEKAFLRQLERLFSLGLKAVVLREKDLGPEEYLRLAEKVKEIAGEGRRCRLILHQYPDAAETLGIDAVHLPLHILRELREKSPERLRRFRTVGTSVHSAEDARIAVQCGAAYLFAGNIYETTCKPGLEGRGLAWLKEVAGSVNIPVYGIGGITPGRMKEILETGAAGGCMMSGSMRL
jgi:thiamine-phosphate pyrophosphorylase